MSTDNSLPTEKKFAMIDGYKTFINILSEKPREILQIGVRCRRLRILLST